MFLSVFMSHFGKKLVAEAPRLFICCLLNKLVFYSLTVMLPYLSEYVVKTHYFH